MMFTPNFEFIFLMVSRESFTPMLNAILLDSSCDRLEYISSRSSYGMCFSIAHISPLETKILAILGIAILSMFAQQIGMHVNVFLPFFSNVLNMLASDLDLKSLLAGLINTSSKSN